MKILHSISLLCTLPLLILSSCASEISSGTYSDVQVGESNTTYVGTIISARYVKVGGEDSSSGSGIGLATGALAGGAIGNNIGSGRGRDTAIIGGALLGALGGSMAEKKLKTQQGIEYVIQLDNGELKTVVQGADSPMNNGQRVLLIESYRGTGSSQGRSRVIPYNGQ